jgi:membrane-bound lytic murein transglycosylase
MVRSRLAAAGIYLACLVTAALCHSRYNCFSSASFSSFSGDMIQECLDAKRLAAFEERKRMHAELPAETEYPVSPYTWHAVTPDELPRMCQSGDLAMFRVALVRQFKRFKELSDESHEKMKFRFGCKVYTRREYSLDVVKKMIGLADKSGSFNAFLVRVAQEFDWYKSDGRLDDSTVYPWLKKNTIQFTAYYLPPPIEATRSPNAEFRFPFYKPPQGTLAIKQNDPPEVSCGNDRITGERRKFCIKNGDNTYAPLPTRRMIDGDAKALKGKDLEIAYVRDPIDIAVVMVQGSGSVNLLENDGRKHVARLNYAAANGRPRNMLARILTCAKVPEVERSSMSSIRQYLEKKGDDKFMYMNYDESYVFFNESDIGPFGTGDIPITDRYSLATDTSVMPTGSVGLFNVDRPEGKIEDCKDITTMAIAQDTGGAIVGAHVDWYQGEGKQAEARADNVNNAGSLFIALPKDAGQLVEGCDISRNGE